MFGCFITQLQHHQQTKLITKLHRYILSQSIRWLLEHGADVSMKDGDGLQSD